LDERIVRHHRWWIRQHAAPAIVDTMVQWRRRGAFALIH